MKHFLKSIGKWQDWRVTVIGISIAFLIIFGLHFITEKTIQENNDVNLMTTATVTALSFDPQELQQIMEQGENASLLSQKYAGIIREIHEKNRNITSVYILQKNGEYGSPKFILGTSFFDSSISGSTGMYNTSEEIVPGGFHENLEHVDFFRRAFYEPMVDPEPRIGFSGLIYSAYAPITNKNGAPFALLGMNVKYNEKQTHFDEMNTFLMYTLAALVFLAFFISFLLMREQIVSEQLTSLNHMKDRFLSIVVHELRTPLVVIRGYSGNILGNRIGKITGKQREVLGSVNKMFMR